jgi:hypothetical protein
LFFAPLLSEAQTLKLRAGSLDTASPKYAELVAKETRRTKDTEKPRRELLDEWQTVGRTFGIDAASLRSQRQEYVPLTPERRAEWKEQVYREAVEALSREHAHWGEAEFTKAVAERSAGRISAHDVRELVEHKLHSPDMICLGGLLTEQKNHEQRRYIDRTEQRFTTRENLRYEREMLGRVERMVRQPRSESPQDLVEEAIQNRPTMDEEQARAVRYLTSGPNIRVLSGIAGTGKSFTLKACHEVWTREGRDVVGCAIAAKTAERLERGTEMGSGNDS